MAEPVDLPFGLWTWVGPHWTAHWCHLANTIEPSVCGGNAVLCQITLTTCLLSLRAGREGDCKRADVVPVMQAALSTH